MEGQKITLVLGAGGAAGWVWHAAVVAALRQRLNIDYADYGTIIGTSAGAAAAAAIRAGVQPDHVIQWVNEPEFDEHRSPHALRQQVGVSNGMSRWKPLNPTLARQALPNGQGMWAAIGGLLPHGRYPTLGLTAFPGIDDHTEWPAGLLIPAMNSRTGELVAFDGRHDIDVATAVEASSAIPGVFQPKQVGDELYIDGGLVSPTNASLARDTDAETIVISSPLSRASNRPLPRFARRRLKPEIARLRRDGHRVIVVSPELHPHAFSKLRYGMTERIELIVASAHEAVGTALADTAAGRLRRSHRRR